MNRSGNIALSRLIAVRREELEPFRIDLLQLGLLCDELENRLLSSQQTFAESIEDFEEGESDALSAHQMLQWRQYLVHLAKIVESDNNNFSEACKQRDKAQSVFSEKYAEIQALERFSDRRVKALANDQRRVDYLFQDDAEVLRRLPKGISHADR